MDYLFQKADLQKLIDENPDMDVIAIRCTFQFGQTKTDFKAVITASAQKKGDAVKAGDPTGPIYGCPNPPGCA
ncbi:hypothetical protein BH11BAC3_BH11BAC3_08690 [soil metagenome]